MKGAADAILRVLGRLLEVMLAVTLAGMSGVVFVNVFCRFVLRFSLSWGEETAQILMVWLTFLGAAVAMRDRLHYAFDYLVRNLPNRARKSSILLSDVLVIAMTSALLYWSAKVTIEIRDWVMPATNISRSLVYGACPVGTFFLLAYAIRNFVSDLRTRAEDLAKEEEKII